MTSPARILVVDDEENIRSSLQEMLSLTGYNVIAVESGEAALKLIAGQEKFDLALIDIKLEGLTGIEVLAMLRRLTPETVVIILTANASLETAVEALRYGAHDYLFKPCKPTELQESIERGLRNRQPELRQQALLHQLDFLASNLEDIRSTLGGNKDGEPFLADFDNTAAVPSPPAEDNPSQPRFLQRGRLTLDFLRHAVTLDGQLIDLSPTEFDLLAYLIQQAPRVVSPQELTINVKKYETDEWAANEAVRQNIYRIRQKIKEFNNDIDIIRTVRGVGYTIEE
ncbi:MAG: response regulator transcription factor [Anaerolineae bacterium]|nr:response regulator transcription factor [Anaerolineae bacterium]MCB9103821.1 response regulator transcription factor [Anaerolineales bacterium]